MECQENVRKSESEGHVEGCEDCLGEQVATLRSKLIMAVSCLKQ